MTSQLSVKEHNLLTGRLAPEEIPSVKAQVIRVYLCSTGTDSVTERDALVEFVYPRLRAYCRDKYSMEFQIVDLHWGLSPQMMTCQSDLTSLRIREIQRCHGLSAGPNFIAFIGQKYGPVSLPDVIMSEEYDAIRLALHGHRGRDTRNAPLLDRCYVMDGNNIPPVYILKEKSVLLAEVQANTNGPTSGGANIDGQPTEEANWEELQQEIKSLILRGAELAYMNGTMESDSKGRYFASDLENQILLGTEINDNPRLRSVLITRTIADLKNYTEDSRTPRFADLKMDEMTSRLEMDPVAQEKLAKLKKRVGNLVGEANITHHDVLWRYDDVIHPQLHKEYLQTLCQRLFDICVRLIDEGVPLPDVQGSLTLCDEARQHWARCRYTASSFYNQHQTLQQLQDYVTGLSCRPLVIHGAPGSGKSKLISKIAFHMSELLKDDYVIVLRYAGHTPRSNELRQLLISVSQQVALACELSVLSGQSGQSGLAGLSGENLPLELKDLTKCFREMLASVPDTTRLVVLIDGLELLHSDGVSLNLEWIPASLPPNVKLVLTAHQTSHGLLERLKHEVLPRDAGSFLEVLPSTVDECAEMLTSLLKSMDRSVTPEQMAALRDVIQGEPLPLYVELLANIAKEWNSFTDAESVKLPRSCEEGIAELLARLESKHGLVLVSRAFAYMVASCTGLSDCEMEDILSLDEDVLNELFRDFHPPLRRVPYIKWIGLKQDVEMFLSYRDADGVTVTMWHHDSFIHAVNSRYLGDEAVVTLVHSNIADYFLGTWANRAKPVNIPNRSSVNLDRKVPQQPYTFGNHDDGSLRYNKRMYNQVPRHLHLAGRHKELDALVYFNYEWLFCKARALSLQHVIDDLELQPSEEVALLEETLRVSRATIERDLSALPTQLTGHLLPYYPTHPNIRSLIRQCDTDGLKHSGVIPNFPYQHVPGSSLQLTLECPGVMEHMTLINDDKHLLAKRRDDPYVHTFDLTTGELKSTVLVSNGELHTTPNNKYLIIVDHVTEKAIKIHASESGEFLKQIIVLNHMEGKTSLYKKGPICLTDDRLCAVVTLANSVLCICAIPSGEVLHIIPLEGKARVCCITPDGRRVFCNSNAHLLAYDVYTLQHLLTVPIGCHPTTLLLTRDGLRAFISNDSDTRLTIMHLNGNQVDMTYRAVLEDRMPGDAILGLTVSPNDALLLIRGSKILLVYHRTSEKIIAAFSKPDDVPVEMKLPRANYVQSVFERAEFTADSSYVVATMLRNVYVWHIPTSTMVKVIQAPIGLITGLVVSQTRSQVITHIDGSTDLQVWNIGDGVSRVNTRDKLTGAIREFQPAAHNLLAFVKCEQGDELGVIDMSSGVITDLLTHDAPVQDFATSPDGNWVLVSTTPRLSGTAFKLWDRTERRIVLEVGNVSGYCVSCRVTDSVLMVAQKENSFSAPYYLSALKFDKREFFEHTYVPTVTCVKSKPFVTHDDQYLVIHSADDINNNSEQSSACICVFDLAGEMRKSTYDSSSIQFSDHLYDILQVWPCAQENTSLIAAIFSCKNSKDNAPDDEDDHTNEKPQRTFGFFLLDVRTGSLTVLCIPFPTPSYEIGAHPLTFTPDCTMCIDDKANIFHTTLGRFIGVASLSALPPQAFALRNTVLISYKDTTLYVTRLADGFPLAVCDVHACVCHVHVCADDRTVLVGCTDGSFFSYTIIDNSRDNPTSVLSALPSRKVGNTDMFEYRSPRSWDRVGKNGCPNYSRPPSAVYPAGSDKLLLRQIKPVSRERPKSDTVTSFKSPVCSVM
ncbi:NACHT and WD repeat domain-containing protein 2-like isoform X2 [Physella acuta]|uniref:NACHT and WD repeat domain-containing protein 2-like isoform X2 n=1 Tax=Physella acuta TaxID=109671 RepID=UPI0027DD2554|nr:NACHT and WD repeat domain-containing protein 2-like isoform X2 [Physella acuta]